ncbi:hypothetical protein J6590_072774 [Homalodisca vitripennis]|nr:hypothetical protein J6590_072774 [Homalodisca vitripennis]
MFSKFGGYLLPSILAAEAIGASMEPWLTEQLQLIELAAESGCTEFSEVCNTKRKIQQELDALSTVCTRFTLLAKQSIDCDEEDVDAVAMGVEQHTYGQLECLLAHPSLSITEDPNNTQSQCTSCYESQSDSTYELFWSCFDMYTEYERLKTWLPCPNDVFVEHSNQCSRLHLKLYTSAEQDNWRPFVIGDTYMPRPPLDYKNIY